MMVFPLLTALGAMAAATGLASGTRPDSVA